MAKIAVLFAAGISKPENYVVYHLAEHWRETGHEVVFLMGTSRFVPADLLLVHVDLSVVPEAYLSFADRYPKVLNRRITDIRKSRVSGLIVQSHDRWSGPVIVKSNLNSGGTPERLFRRTWFERRSPTVRRVRDAIERRIRSRSRFPYDGAYKVFPNVGAVPEGWWCSSDCVVEKFVPEIENGLFHLRMHQFLGNRYLSVRLCSDQPLLKTGNSTCVVDVEPHPMVEQWRREFAIDYGKFDYVVADGEAVLLDVNKTVGSSLGPRVEAEVAPRRRYLAQGIDAFL